ncbi:penicillin-binding protein [Chaetomium tenue]|uniref:Penicillin-binding protein n=1 Tax=Chaetomium tenue TaxID=1854479 RepID=A0ACB7PAU4_9PEZI|nr:penicillin-binding protein [Chaetomium globosum]
MFPLAPFVVTIGLIILSLFRLTCRRWPLSWSWQRTEGPVERLHQTSIRSARPICEISGVAGMSVGVMHHGEVIFRDNFGLRAAGGNLSPDSKTLYGIGSLTKAFTAAAMMNLLDHHPNITLDTPVDRILPDFIPMDKRLRGQISLADFLSHRSGLLGDMSFALQGQSECLLPKEQLLPTVSRLKTIAPIRRQWLYNNWGYGIAGAVIEKWSGKSFAAYLKESILEPLGLKHTTSQPDFQPQDNFANTHISLCDAKPLPVSGTSFFKDTFFEPAGGLYSNIDDMLTWAKAVLRADANPSDGPLRHIRTIISNQIPLHDPSRDFRFYGLGWIRTQLPGVVGLQGDNPALLPLDDLPILGAGGPKIVTYYHQGSALGYYSALFLFPETESAIIVLTNSIPLNDATDWIAQAYVSALFNFTKPANYVALAGESRRSKVAALDSIRSNFDELRRNHPGNKPQLPLQSYWGIYDNDADNFFIDIGQHTEIEDSLLLKFQGKETQAYELRHLYDDTFEWSLTCDESARRGRSPILDPEYFKVRFHIESGVKDAAKHVTSFQWAGLADHAPEGHWMRRRKGIGNDHDQEVLDVRQSMTQAL